MAVSTAACLRGPEAWLSLTTLSVYNSQLGFDWACCCAVGRLVASANRRRASACRRGGEGFGEGACDCATRVRRQVSLDPPSVGACAGTVSSRNESSRSPTRDLRSATGPRCVSLTTRDDVGPVVWLPIAMVPNQLIGRRESRPRIQSSTW